MGCCPSGPPKIPAMPLLANIWWGQGAVIPVGLPNIALVACTLVLGDRIPYVANLNYGCYILFPALTDVAAAPRNLLLPNADLVECPAGSLRYYVVEFVDDVAKGFANQYRSAMVRHGPAWPAPLP